MLLSCARLGYWTLPLQLKLRVPAKFLFADTVTDWPAAILTVAALEQVVALVPLIVQVTPVLAPLTRNVNTTLAPPLVGAELIRTENPEKVPATGDGVEVSVVRALPESNPSGE